MHHIHKVKLIAQLLCVFRLKSSLNNPVKGRTHQAYRTSPLLNQSALYTFDFFMLRKAEVTAFDIMLHTMGLYALTSSEQQREHF